MNGCGHCKSMKPAWESAVAENPTNIQMVDYEMSSPEGQELCKTHNVTGFPTMFLLDGNKKIDYTGGRLKKDFLDFLHKF